MNPATEDNYTVFNVSRDPPTEKENFPPSTEARCWTEKIFASRLSTAKRLCGLKPMGIHIDPRNYTMLDGRPDHPSPEEALQCDGKLMPIVK